MVDSQVQSSSAAGSYSGPSTSSPDDGFLRQKSLRKTPAEIMQFQREWDVGKDYDVKKQIGQGSYGNVCEAVHKATGTKVAIKKILNLF